MADLDIHDAAVLDADQIIVEHYGAPEVLVYCAVGSDDEMNFGATLLAAPKVGSSNA